MYNDNYNTWGQLESSPASYSDGIKPQDNPSKQLESAIDKVLIAMDTIEYYAGHACDTAFPRNHDRTLHDNLRKAIQELSVVRRGF